MSCLSCCWNELVDDIELLQCLHGDSQRIHLTKGYMYECVLENCVFHSLSMGHITKFSHEIDVLARAI